MECASERTSMPWMESARSTREVPPPYRKNKFVREFENIPGKLRYMINAEEVDRDLYERAIKACSKTES